MHRQLRAEARTEYTLDIDATVIEAEKEAAQWSYKGVKGYTPGAGKVRFLAGERLVGVPRAPGALRKS